MQVSNEMKTEASECSPPCHFRFILKRFGLQLKGVMSPFSLYSELLKIILQLPSCISVAASYQIVRVPHLPSKLAATFGSVFKKGTFFLFES